MAKAKTDETKTAPKTRAAKGSKETIQINLQLPHDTKGALDAFCACTNMNRVEALRECLVHGINAYEGLSGIPALAAILPDEE